MTTYTKYYTPSDLASQFHMVHLDLRGHGLSDRLTDPAAFQEGQTWADDIHAVITALDLHKPVLTGWSYGGFIICDYVRHYGQDNLGGIIFVAAATEIGRDEANQLLGGDFLSLVPGFFSHDYAEGTIALERFMGLATYEELDSHALAVQRGLMSPSIYKSSGSMLAGRSRPGGRPLTLSTSFFSISTHTPQTRATHGIDGRVGVRD